MKNQKSVTFSQKILTDEGVEIVNFNCMINETFPLGFSDQRVIDKALFDKNKAELKKAYEVFIEQATGAAEVFDL